MAILALEHLFDQVVSRFALDAAAATPAVDPVPNLFGWRELDTKLVVNARIAWAPGDPQGNLGAVNPARNPGRNPRSLATLEELCTVEISAHDPSAPENERAQYHATRELFDAWFRAVYLAAHGTFRIVSSAWVVDRKVRRFGATLRVVIGVQAVLADAPLEQAPAGTTGRLMVRELDRAEPNVGGVALVTNAGHIVEDISGDVVEVSS